MALSVSLNSLPLECLEHILFHLQAHELIKAISICRSVRNHLRQGSSHCAAFWKRKCAIDFVYWNREEFTRTALMSLRRTQPPNLSFLRQNGSRNLRQMDHDAMLTTANKLSIMRSAEGEQTMNHINWTELYQQALKVVNGVRRINKRMRDLLHTRSSLNSQLQLLRDRIHALSHRSSRDALSSITCRFREAKLNHKLGSLTTEISKVDIRIRQYGAKLTEYQQKFEMLALYGAICTDATTT